MLEARGEAEICSADDAVWLQDCPENKAIINSLFELGGSPEVEKFRDVIGRRFVFVRDADGEKLFPKATRYLSYKSGRCFNFYISYIYGNLLVNCYVRAPGACLG